jgi:pimeloyl-ACP methyl ester carboxylesterase
MLVAKDPPGHVTHSMREHMQARLLFRNAFAVAISITAVVIQAKEATLKHKGLTLNANVELAAGMTLADGAILITHGALAHYGMETVVYLQKLFKDRGHNTLAINLSLGLDNRHGMYDCKVIHRHRNDDAADEIGAWVNWLQKQGSKRVALIGHSRGGAQTALFAAERDHALVKAVVLLAPATRDNTDAAAYQRRYNQPLAPMLEKADKLIREGKGDTLLERANLMQCRDIPVTAEGFVSYYGPKARVDALSLIPKIKKPTLVVVAGNDEIVVGLDKKAPPLVDGKRVQLKVVDGADHMFRDLFADDAVDAIDAFLKGAGY